MDNTAPRKTWLKSELYMDTVVSLKIVTSRCEADVEESMSRAFEAFQAVERVCSRFDDQSEVRRLSQHVGTPVPVSDLLFEAIRFAWNMADLTAGAFDLTVGHRLESYGFNRHYLTRTISNSGLNPNSPVGYMDVVLDEEKRTVLLRKPLILDLGAVAKGLAVDLAAKALLGFEGFAIDAGGDIFVGGLNDRESAWHVGIRHPVRKDENIGLVKLTDAAVCTSGSYERKSPVRANTHHLIDSRSGLSPSDIVSCTVIAPYTMMADAFSTAAFILGWDKGIEFLDDAGLAGMFVTSGLEIHTTDEMKRYMYELKNE